MEPVDMKKKILILDDKPSIAKVIAVYLSEEYDFTYFENPIQGLNWLHEGNMPDLIVTDIHMPHMGGEEFIVLMKKNEFFKHIPIVILSGEESSNVRIRLLEEGADDYILKPFNPMELKIRIRKVLQ